jgi:hypothetical protein
MTVLNALLEEASRMRKCRNDFMYAAREFRCQRRPGGWVRAQVRMARRANRLMLECLREAREVRS